jgi:hypothetical protein
MLQYLLLEIDESAPGPRIAAASLSRYSTRSLRNVGTASSMPGTPQSQPFRHSPLSGIDSLDNCVVGHSGNIPKWFTTSWGLSSSSAKATAGN